MAEAVIADSQLRDKQRHLLDTAPHFAKDILLTRDICLFVFSNYTFYLIVKVN